jgi:putative oxidoreductase
VAAAAIFWRSAMTKITLNEDAVNFSWGQIWQVITLKWEVSDMTYMLFENEYDVPLISSNLAANMALLAEILLPILLILGLATRLSALALLMMVLVIQIFVFPASWPDHMIWVISLLFLMKNGSGPFALDNMIERKCS